MTDSEKLAIAAHLHVLLRRKVGRVTDVEWMIKSREYAVEVIRVCRTQRQHPELGEWADKLERAVGRASSREAARPVAAVDGASVTGQEAAPSVAVRGRHVLGLR